MHNHSRLYTELQSKIAVRRSARFTAILDSVGTIACVLLFCAIGYLILIIK